MQEPKLWYRRQNGTWYVMLNGKQTSLGKDEDQARKKYHATVDEEFDGARFARRPSGHPFDEGESHDRHRIGE